MVLIGIKKGLIWGCKEEAKERILWCLGAVYTVSVKNSISKRRRKIEREEKGGKQ